MNEPNQASLLAKIAEHAVPNDLNLWPAIQSQLSANRASMATKPSQLTGVRLLRRRPLLALASAAVVALAVGVTVPPWNHPEAASAQEILDRAEATANGAVAPVTSYRLNLTRHIVAKGNTTIESQVWFDGSDRQRSDDVIRDASGAVVSSSSAIFNGSQTWLATTADGKTTVVHTTGTTWTRPVDAPTQPASLASVLRSYADSKGCVRADKAGETTVAGRPTYEIALTFQAAGCPAPGTSLPKPKAAGGGSAPNPDASDNSVATMTVWVDRENFLPLETVVRNPAGAVLDESIASNVQYNVAIPAATFRYTPPAGATVHEFTGGNGADVKRQLGPNGFPGTSPSKIH
jgi:hypothetical protein